MVRLRTLAVLLGALVVVLGVAVLWGVGQLGAPAPSEPVAREERPVETPSEVPDAGLPPWTAEAGRWERALTAADPLSDRLEDRVRNFAEATISYNAPKTMHFRETTRVQLVLAPETSDIDPATLLSPDLEGAIETAAIEYGLRMQATLSGGTDFEIEPGGPQAQTILPDRAAHWNWQVRPVRFGEDKILTLRLDAILSRDGRDLPPIHVQTYSAQIVVDVGLWDRTVALAEEVKTVHAVAAGVGASLIGIGGWLWRRRRQPEAPPEA